MGTRSFTAVVNPAAGSGAAEAALAPVAELLQRAGATVTVAASRGAEDAGRRAREASARGDIVLAAGGDGTVSLLAGAAVEAGGVLGVIPAGRGNDFARQLAIPRDPAALAPILLDGDPRIVDVIEVVDNAGQGRICVCSVYSGLDSAANFYVDQARHVPRKLVYMYGALRAIASFKPASYRITVDGQEHAHRGMLAVIANSASYGDGMHIAPGAVVDDGLLDVVLVSDLPKLRMVAALKEIYTGRHVERPEVTVLRGAQITLDAERPLPVYGDGESITTLPVTVRVRPGALRVLAPH